jgi:ribosomal protein L37E
MVHYRCRDCGRVDMVFADGVRIIWCAQEQRWDIDPDGRTQYGRRDNLRCGDCESWNIEECEKGESMQSDAPTPMVCRKCGSETVKVEYCDDCDHETTLIRKTDYDYTKEYDPDTGRCHDCGRVRPDWQSRTNCSECGVGLDWNCVPEHQCNTPQAKRKPHVHTYEQKPGGERRMDANCGTYVCLECNDHAGLARCYCGWASDGGNGVAQLRAEGENVEDDY